MTTRKFILAAVAALTLLGAACGDVASDTDSSSGGSGIDQGMGSADASGDVKVTAFAGPDVLGLYTATVEVTNHSSGTSDYYIEANVLDPQGTVTGYTNGLVNQLAAGAKASLDLIPTEAGDGYTVQITTVQRTAS